MPEPQTHTQPHIKPSRILIIRPSALGDVVRTVPALVSLRTAFPKAEIDWLVESGFEEAITAHPALSSVISFPKRAIKSSWLRPTSNPLWKLCSQLRAARYDAVFDLQGLARSAFLTWLTGASARYGPREAREGGWLAYTHKVPTSHLTHTVDRMLAVVAACGINTTFDMQLHAPSHALDALVNSPLGDIKYALLAPTSRWPAWALPPA